MKKTNIIATALAGLLTVPALTSADDSKPQAGDILQDINMFNPEDGDPAYKVRANDRYGTQWGVDVAYGFWGTHHATADTNGNNNFALLHAQLNQRLIQNDTEGGTWLRVEISGSWALDPRSARSDGGATFAEGFGSTTSEHPDIMGPHDLFFPEVALMQYFAGKRACVIAGMVNLTNYFDAVGIANDTFSGFVNSGFVNSTILPLYDSNVGAVFQVELNRKNYVMLAASRSGVAMGYGPFNGASDGYCIVGEYGHIFHEGRGVLRIDPFFAMIDEEAEEGGTRHRRNAGIVGSVEYSPGDRLTLYARAGVAAKQYLSPAAELSFGANVHLFSSRPDDFLGVSYGVFKGQTPYEQELSDEEVESGAEPEHGHHRETVLELMYSVQVTDYFKMVPHFQYIHNPSYRACRDAHIWGIQGVFSF